MEPSDELSEYAEFQEREQRKIITQWAIPQRLLEEQPTNYAAERVTGGPARRIFAWLWKSIRPLLLLLLLQFPAQAGTMLLLEIGWENQPQALPAVYAFGVENEGAHYALWQENVTAYPYSSVAAPETVDRFNEILTGETLGRDYPLATIAILDDFLGLGTANVLQRPELPALCVSCRWHRLLGQRDDGVRTAAEWAAFAESVGWRVTKHVPLLRAGMRGYELTAMDRTVTADAQTIRFYGIETDVIVPEPAAWLLVLLGLTIHWRLRWKMPMTF